MFSRFDLFDDVGRFAPRPAVSVDGIAHAFFFQITSAVIAVVFAAAVLKRPFESIQAIGVKKQDIRRRSDGST